MATICLIGCGAMGGALLRGWLAHDLPHQFHIVERAALSDDLSVAPNVHAVEDVGQLPKDLAFDMVVVAIKPQQLEELRDLLGRIVSEGTTLLSVMAGTAMVALGRVTPDSCPIIRAMPNLPAAIGQGMTVAVADTNVSADHKNLASELLSAAGEFAWLEDEALMDTVTAVSGSGPAYVFYLTEALAEAGKKLGLPDELAEQMARQTVIGSAALMASKESTSAATLRENVTSPNGTTAAALEILMKDEGLASLMAEAVKAAEKRGQELSGI